MTAAGSGFGSAKPMNPVGWLGLPMLLAVAATVFLATPIHIFGFALPEPVFPLALAFAWAQIRPSVLPPFALLLLGLFLDVFWGGPQGLWPLCLLASYASVLAVRRLITGQELVDGAGLVRRLDGGRLRRRLPADVHRGGRGRRTSSRSAGSTSPR